MSGKHDAEVLQHAAGVIERDGWTRGTYRDDDGRVCLAGAIGVALTELKPILGSDPLWLAEVHEERYGDLLWPVIEEQYPEWCAIYEAGPITRWNDDELRTKEEVVAILEKAAVRLSEQV